MLKNHICIVFAIEHYNPLGVIRSLGEAGIRPNYIAIKGKAKVASTSKYINKCHYVDNVEQGYQILMSEYGGIAKSLGKKPIIFCSDDRTIGYLDEHYKEMTDKFIFYNAGETGRISKYMDKHEILELAKKHGLKVLDNIVVKRGEIPEGIEYPIITKSISPNVGGWKSDVHICHSNEELKLAFEQIEAHTVLIQKYIEKKNEYCLEGFSGPNGKQTFISIASTYSYILPDYYSPRQNIKNFNNKILHKALSEMLKEIGFSGIFEIEFLIDQDETLYFGEINFRNATWSYASTVAGMPLPILWATAELEGGFDSEKIYRRIPEEFYAMVEPIDYKKRVGTGMINPMEWAKDFKNANCTYYYNVADPELFEEMCRNFDALV